MCQPPCCVLIVFSLRCVNKYRLSNQCFVYEANGYSGSGCLIDPQLASYFDFFSPSLLGGFSYAQSTVSYVIYCLDREVDRLLFCVLQLLRKVSAYAFRITNALLPFPLTVAFLSYFCKCLLESQRSEKIGKPVH